MTWCFYACEEVDRDDNGLAQLWRDRPELLAGRRRRARASRPAALVEAGCQGTMRVGDPPGRGPGPHGPTFAGRQRHPPPGPGARPGGRLGARPVDPSTAASTSSSCRRCRCDGGVAGNVVPDARLGHPQLPLRPRPGRPGGPPVPPALFDGLLDEAYGDRIEVVDEVAGAPPSLDHPLLAGPGGRAPRRPPRAKLGWTDVATFCDHGVPAANFGPGDPLLAHHPDERVERPSLDRVRAVLGALLTETT